MSKSDPSQPILDEFDNHLTTYSKFGSEACKLIESLVGAERIVTVSITHRCKSRESLQKKITRPESPYQKLADVTDVVGVRVITYFCDDVDRIAALLKSEFLFDNENSIDKRALLEPDRFGYQSLHYILQLGDNRSSLGEYKRFRGLKFEVQIRSVLQHAWAEIQHDRGYRFSHAIPKHISRKFARVAGLLEIADSEFREIRDQLDDYEKRVNEDIQSKPSEVDLNEISLGAFYSSSTLVQEIDEHIANYVGANILPLDQNTMELHLRGFRTLDITTVGGLESALSSFGLHIKGFAEEWLKYRQPLRERTIMRVVEGVGMIYLGYFIASTKGGKSLVLRFLEEAKLSDAQSRESLAEELHRVCQHYRESNALDSDGPSKTAY